MAFYTTIKGYQLPTHLLIEIVKVETSKKVYIHSAIHQNKKVEVTLSWCAKFSDEQILNDNDLFTTVCDMYELSLAEVLKQN